MSTAIIAIIAVSIALFAIGWAYYVGYGDGLKGRWLKGKAE